MWYIILIDYQLNLPTAVGVDYFHVRPQNRRLPVKNENINHFERWQKSRLRFTLRLLYRTLSDGATPRNRPTSVCPLVTPVVHVLALWRPGRVLGISVFKYSDHVQTSDFLLAAVWSRLGIANLIHTALRDGTGLSCRVASRRVGRCELGIRRHELSLCVDYRRRRP